MQSTNESPFLVPPVGIREEDDRVVIQAELPGVTRENLDLIVEEDDLTIRGVRPAADEKLRTVYSEHPAAEFRRRFVLGNIIDRGRIEASLKDGILEVVLYKTKEETPRRIEVS
ncbi:MAG TPA: Hsp20/alpha crystallin family protein [bacterium]|nr:Hsp20/alpha crystallin family protein [bacterium]HPJ71870.1 Hsp20/alpha crystallin family protein [bacterium]HPQ66660.1 Hsp20/alpha crystallin family protein [bacterium]